MKKILCFILCTFMMINFCAIPGNSIEEITGNRLTSIANYELEKRGYDVNDILNISPLYNSDDEIIGYCIDFEDSYAIVDTNGYVLEHSSETNSPYYENDSVNYYGGPLQYFIKRGEDFYRLSNNQLVTKEEFQQLDLSLESLSSECQISHSTAINNAALLSSGYNIETKKIPGNTRPLNYNTQGTCGPLAATILLFYYHDYNLGITLLPYESNYPASLHSLLAGLYYHGEGTDYSSLPAGLNTFFSDRGYNATAIATTSSFLGALKYRINVTKRPVILGLYSTTGSTQQWSIDHWVVAYGYKLYYQNGQLYNTEIIVNDGWGHTNICITYSTAYMDGIVSLNI